MKKKILFACFVCMTAIACSRSSSLEKKELTLVRTDGSRVHVTAEIARTEQERAAGFMEREVIPDGTGMLFVFERDQILSFWMKNTPHPLSIAFIDSAGIIRDIFDMKPFSLASRSSSVSVRYALEVPQGWFSRAGIAVGDRIELGW